MTQLRFQTGFTAITVLFSTIAMGPANKFYGEPVNLKSNFMYFTSWKYVQPGGVTWDSKCFRRNCSVSSSIEIA